MDKDQRKDPRPQSLVGSANRNMSTGRGGAGRLILAPQRAPVNFGRLRPKIGRYTHGQPLETPYATSQLSY